MLLRVKGNNPSMLFPNQELFSLEICICLWLSAVSLPLAAVTDDLVSASVITFQAKHTIPTIEGMNKFQEGLQQQRRLIEQLRCEAQITRMRVSQCIDDLQKYCEAHIEEDYLIRGFSKPSENPYKEKGGCSIL